MSGTTAVWFHCLCSNSRKSLEDKCEYFVLLKGDGVWPCELTGTCYNARCEADAAYALTCFRATPTSSRLSRCSLVLTVRFCSPASDPFVTRYDEGGAINK